MFCPESGKYQDCSGNGCPFYVVELDDCLRALQVKKELDILSQKERLALTTIRKQGR